jgi:hypothetical protein
MQCVGVSDGAASLLFRVPGDKLRELPETIVAFREENPGDFVGPSTADHALYDRKLAGHLPDLNVLTGRVITVSLTLYFVDALTRNWRMP